MENKWDLTELIKDNFEFETVSNDILNIVTKLETYKGKIMESANTLYNFLLLDEQSNILFDKIATYAHLTSDLNTKEDNGQSLMLKIDKLSEICLNKLSFIYPEIVSTDYSVVKNYIDQNEKLKKYEFYFEKYFRYKKHSLSFLEEDLITKASIALGTPGEVFYKIDNADVNFGNIIDETGSEVLLTHGNYTRYRKSDNREVRKAAFENIHNYYGNLKNTLASTYVGKVKENFFFSNVRKYNSPLEASLYSDNVDLSVYKNLIDAVHNKLYIMHDYFDLKKQVLNLNELHMYDINADLIKTDNKTITYEESKKIVIEALKPMGKTYINDLQQAFSNKWIDVYPSDGKVSGAYQTGVYNSHPYVLLNFSGVLNDTSTLAHELGHAMHHYYSSLNQDYLYFNVSIFTAEVASIVNEILLNDYLYKNAKTKDEKIFHLSNMLENVRGTLYRQTMFAEFEMIIHEKEEKGIPLTEKEISDTYYDLNKLYHGNNVISDDLIRHEWSRIPHFYSSFYVYKYATGFSCALAMASDILNEVPKAKENYLKFLKNGGSDYPLNILKTAGVDMSSSEPINKALNMALEKLTELKKLLK